MKTIYKYPFQVRDFFEVAMPTGAQILKIECQDGIPYIWAIVETAGVGLERRVFRIYGTGHALPANPGRHLATFQQGQFVWHIFE